MNSRVRESSYAILACSQTHSAEDFLWIKSLSTPVNSISNMYACFGPRGWLEQRHPNFEFRAGQLQMAQEVEAAFRGRPGPATPGLEGHRSKIAERLPPAVISGSSVAMFSLLGCRAEQ
jgi:hypothetical protein